jgi:hypothetical protein
VARNRATKRAICDPIEGCIYCGAVGGVYTDEHVIPAGLDGTWTIPKASCGSCQVVTSGFEQQVLRGFLHVPRVAMGSFTRRPSQRPATLPIRVDNVEYDVPVDEFPASLVLVDFVPPAIETGELGQQGIRLRSYQIASDLAKVRALVNARVRPVVKPAGVLRGDTHEVGGSAEFSHSQLASFVRLLAKIAHCLAVARLGKERMADTFLVPLILGRDTNYNHLVGSVRIEQPLWSLPRATWMPEAPPIPGQQETHRVSLVRERGFWVSYVQLYRNRFGGRGPIYKVYVCGA